MQICKIGHVVAEFRYSDIDHKAYVYVKDTAPDGTVTESTQEWDININGHAAMEHSGTIDINGTDLDWWFHIFVQDANNVTKLMWKSELGEFSKFYQTSYVPPFLCEPGGCVFITHTHTYQVCEDIPIPPDEFPYANTKEDYEALNSAYIGNHEYSKDRTADRIEKIQMLKILNTEKE